MERLLLIEDSRFFVNVICNAFKAQPTIDVVVAGTCAEAKAYLATAKPLPTLALVDLQLPDAPDGAAVDLVIDHGVPAVVFTSNFDEAIRERFLNKGVLDFVLKDNPSSLEALIGLTGRVLKNRATTALVVDDSPVARRFCCDLLRRYQLNVAEANSAEGGLYILNQRSDIRLVITDHEMPGMNGFEFATAIRRRFSRDQLAIIGVSGTHSSILSVKFIKHGANDFINKPYAPEELYTRVALNLEILDKIEALTTAAMRDALTGLYNRRSFFEFGRRLVAASRRAGALCAVVIMDIDHFKSINDTFGHDTGDAVLKSVAGLLTQHTQRGGDLCARLGGEEFALVLQGDTPDQIAGHVEGLRRAIEAAVVAHDGRQVQVTASFGGVMSKAPDLDRMITAADLRLYEAKRAGRNRAVWADLSPA